MTITLDLTATAVYAATALYIAYVLLNLIRFSLKASDQGPTEISNLGNQIAKLVMINNIDRAIKTCNSVPENLWAPSLKLLLIHRRDALNKNERWEHAYFEAKDRIAKNAVQFHDTKDLITVRILDFLFLGLMAYVLAFVTSYYGPICIFFGGSVVLSGILHAQHRIGRLGEREAYVQVERLVILLSPQPSK